MLIGHIKEIMRHPVKSFTGEHVKQTQVMDYGLYGDRSHAFKDETREDKFLTITQFSKMVRYKARFAGEESNNSFPKVEITTPEGRVVEWGNEELKKTIERESKRPVSFVSYSPKQVPLGAIEEEHLQLVTDASLNHLKKLWGTSDVDYRRFRPNILLSLIDQTPFLEETWFEKTLKLGSEVMIQLKRHCERCMIITVDPENAEREGSLHQVILNERKNYFGVYASVLKTGIIHVGDEVIIYK